MLQIDLTGKNALITGGTRGIGRAISLTLARAGARIAAIYRSDSATAARTLEELHAISDDVDHFTREADIADEAQATEAVQQVGERFGGELDFLILDAAAGAGGSMTGMKTEDWKRPFEVNVHGAFYVVRAAAPMLRRGGSIVFLSSGAGHDPIEGLTAYGASKAAVNHLATVLAQELGPQGIRVNVVSPGHTDKGDTDPNAHPENYTPGQKQIVETTALRRLGTAQDVANVVLFFVSDLSSFTTGQWIRVNGGRI
ncbi:MAG TPA: SDR family NAD(P)-dependent oxidoreductase [Chthonomonadaceae bacterium]|nr:SDR family NAD(P)-dependent oxidoreductase [Chthonomonadaceae bacterium]